MKVIIAGGGTGGHLYPGIAIAEKLREQGVEILFWVSRKGKEARVLQPQGFDFRRIDICGWQRKVFAWQTVKFGWKMLLAVLKAIKCLAAFKPDVVVGMGGYVCVPAAIAGRGLRIPVLLHEQNVIPGKANRLLVRFGLVDKIALSFSQSLNYVGRSKAVVTGNPLRNRMGQLTAEEAKKAFDLKLDRFTLLVFGGSRGASQINMAMLEALKYLGEQSEGLAGLAGLAGPAGLQVIWACGEEDYPKIKEAALLSPINIRLAPYIFEMAEAYAASDLVICRAGATTLAEIVACKLPAILVPYPYATDDHQTANARVLEEVGAAVVLKDAQVGGQKLAELVLSLCRDRSRLKEMAGGYHHLDRPEAAAKLIELIYDLAGQDMVGSNPLPGEPV